MVGGRVWVIRSFEFPFAFFVTVHGRGVDEAFSGRERRAVRRAHTKQRVGGFEQGRMRLRRAKEEFAATCLAHTISVTAPEGFRGTDGPVRAQVQEFRCGDQVEV